MRNMGRSSDVCSSDLATTCIGETAELTGAEQVCATRAATPEVAKKFLDTWQAYMDEVIEPHKTSDLSASQPTKGHIAGGLTTIEAKSFGNLTKLGKTTKLIADSQPDQQPSKRPVPDTSYAYLASAEPGYEEV